MQKAIDFYMKNDTSKRAMFVGIDSINAMIITLSNLKNPFIFDGSGNLLLGFPIIRTESDDLPLIFSKSQFTVDSLDSFLMLLCHRFLLTIHLLLMLWHNI